MMQWQRNEIYIRDKIAERYYSRVVYQSNKSRINVDKEWGKVKEATRQPVQIPNSFFNKKKTALLSKLFRN